uniref:Uncharacterized protein n=1 Tax=Fagus sylvatica TaxID=28930 RepID=A0A2N9F6B7_FAGSY
MFEPMSLIEGYLKEFIERLTKIEEAQKKNPRVKDEERRKEEEKARVALERNKEFESFTENFEGKKWRKFFALGKKIFGNSSKAPNVQANINAVQPNQCQYQLPSQNQYHNSYSNPPKQTFKPMRHFDPLGAPMSKVFDHMCKRGHLKPLDPVPPPNPLPNTRSKISTTMMSYRNPGLLISLMYTRTRYQIIRRHILPTRSTSLKQSKEIKCSPLTMRLGTISWEMSSSQILTGFRSQSGLGVPISVWFVGCRSLRHQDQSLPERKGQIEEEREISAPSGDARKALLSEVGAQVTILNSTFSWKEADRAAAKRATHILAELAKNIVNVIVEGGAIPALVKHLQGGRET